MTCVCISVLTLKDKRPWSVFYAELIKHPSVTELLNEAFFLSSSCATAQKNHQPSQTMFTWRGVKANLCGCMTHQYGVPMKESLLCKVLVFLADTPKSAERRNKLQSTLSYHQAKQ